MTATARELTDRLVSLLRAERGAMADFILTLIELDDRQLWVGLGHPSLFDYLVRRLRMSNGAAFYRCKAVELVRAVPEVIAPLRDGRLCITSIVSVARVVTRENKDEVLPLFFGKSRDEAKAIAAELRPVEAPPRRDVVTVMRAGQSDPLTAAILVGENAGAGALPAAAAQGATAGSVVTAAAANSGLALGPSPAEGCGAGRPNTTSPVRAQRDGVEPLGGKQHRVHFNVGDPVVAKLAAVRDALSHALPNASLGEIFEAGLDAILERHAKRNGRVDRPRKAPATANDTSRAVPAHVRRAVWKRDGGRCQWPLAVAACAGRRTACSTTT